MTIIPKVLLLDMPDTDYINVDCMLKTLPTGGMLKDLLEIDEMNIVIDDVRYQLNGSKDKEHWYTYLDFRRFSSSSVIQLELITISKAILFKV